MLAKQYLDEQDSLIGQQLDKLQQELRSRDSEVPTKHSSKGNYWTPAMAEAKEAAWRAQQPRHQAKFTKSQPTTKARKAARKRAKAGRKAAR